MAARHAVTGEALTAARDAPLPAAQRGGRRKAVGQPGIATQHLHAEGHRFDLRRLRQFVDEAFIEKGGIMIGIAPPAAGRQTHCGGMMIYRYGAKILGRDHAGNRSEEQTSELQYIMSNTFAVFCLNKKDTA